MGKIIQIRRDPKAQDHSYRKGDPANRLNFSFVSEGFSLEDLGAEWRSLEKSVSSPVAFFQSHLWVMTWWKHFSDAGRFQLRVLTARYDGELVLIWPMVIARRGWLNRLEPAGGHLSCFGDALVADGPDRILWLKLALEELRSIRGVDGIHFNAVHQQSSIYELMLSEANDVICSGASPVVRTKGWLDFDSFLASRSKSFRKEIRSSRRKLESEGALRELINDPKLSPRRAVETILAFKRDWIRDQGLRSKTILSPKGEAFLADFCEQVSQRSGAEGLIVNSILFDDRLVACGIAFHYFGQQYEYIGGFDHGHREQGVGKVQLSSSIAHAIKSGSNGCNLLTPVTKFKMRWTDDLPAVVQIFSPLTWKGRWYRDVYLKRLRPQLKRVYHLLKTRKGCFR